MFDDSLCTDNKIDQISIEEVDRLARLENTVVVSCEIDLGLDYLVHQIWFHLELMRVSTKKRGQFPDLDDSLIVKKGTTVEVVCRSIHRSLVDEFKYALVWGTSTKHSPQRVGLVHVLEDDDVVQIVKRKSK